MMQICSMPESIASSPMIWMTGLVSPSRSTSGNISFCTALEAGYWRVPRPAAVMTAFLTLAMRGEGKRKAAKGKRSSEADAGKAKGKRKKAKGGDGVSGVAAAKDRLTRV